MRSKLLFSSLILLLVFIGIVGCSADDSSEDQPVIFASDSWASSRFYTEVAEFIVKHGYEYETDQVTGSASALLTGMAQDEVDVQMEIWSKNMGEQYEEDLENGVYQLLSINFDDNKQGIYVPTYVIEGDEERGIEPMAPDLKYVSDLPEYWEIFEDPEDSTQGRLIGWLSGTETDNSLKSGFDYYDLGDYFYYFRPGSEAAIDASIIDAYEAGEPWVGYSYDPHWIMGKYDMTLLEEEEGEDAFDNLSSQDIQIISSNSLVERAEDVTEFLSNFSTSADIANEALTFMEEDEDASEYDAAINFLENHKSMWEKWVPEDVAERVNEALEE